MFSMISTFCFVFWASTENKNAYRCNMMIWISSVLQKRIIAEHKFLGYKLSEVTKFQGPHFERGWVCWGHLKISHHCKPKDLLLIRKFVRRMRVSKSKIVNGQIFEKAANLGALPTTWNSEMPESLPSRDFLKSDWVELKGNTLAIH